jgi:hypothetical protein
MLIYGYPTGRQGRIKRRARRRRRRFNEFKALMAAIGLVVTTALMYAGAFALLFWVAKWFQ